MSFFLDKKEPKNQAKHLIAARPQAVRKYISSCEIWQAAATILGAELVEK